MEDDYFSVDAILAENQVSYRRLTTFGLTCSQKVQCTFKCDILDMGHLGGNTDQDVCILTRFVLKQSTMLR
jgi:hypothetical protein